MAKGKKKNKKHQSQKKRAKTKKLAATQIDNVLVELFKGLNKKTGKFEYAVTVSKFNNLIKKWHQKQATAFPTKREGLQRYDESIAFIRKFNQEQKAH